MSFGLRFVIHRPGVIHVYGCFDEIDSRGVKSWLEEYNLLHIEWIDDCSLNLVFQESFTVKRVLKNICKTLPNPIGSSEIEEMTGSGWLYGMFDARMFFLRRATTCDVKQFTVTQSHPRKTPLTPLDTPRSRSRSHWPAMIPAEPSGDLQPLKRRKLTSHLLTVHSRSR